MPAFMLYAILSAITFFFRSLDSSDGGTIPNIVLSSRGFSTLLIGFTLGKALKIPIEKQSRKIYKLRVLGSILLLAGLVIALL